MSTFQALHEVTHTLSPHPDPGGPGLGNSWGSS